jgi:hypothetical protein
MEVKFKQMNKGIILIMIPVIASTTSIIVFSLPTYNATAQVNPQDRFFEKNFCETESTVLNGVNYISGSEISYSSSGCPVSSIVIHNWNDINTANKSLITARLSANGYSDVTEQVQALQN